MEKLTQSDLNTRLIYHRVWQWGFLGGRRMKINGYDLRGLDFSFNNLYAADLSGSDARGANFMGCVMPAPERLPMMYLSDSWGADYYGSEDKAEDAWRKAI